MKKYWQKFKQFLKRYSWWHSALVIIGAVAVCSVLLTLFTPIGNSIKPIELSTPLNVEEDAFMTSIAHITDSSVGHGGTIEILNNGDPFMDSMLAEIKKAKKTINFSTYIWDGGEMHDRIFDALIEKQKEGVEVRVLVDSFGGKEIPQEDVEKLRDAGGQVAFFRPATIGKLTRFHQRNHRRAIVFDGTVAYTGGIGVEDKWLGNATNDKEWRDMMFKLTGPLAQSLQSSFTDVWASATGEIVTGHSFYPHDNEVSKGLEYISLATNPVKDIAPLSKFYVVSILSAQKSIHITTPYLIPDKSIRKALIEKAEEGVSIVLILPNKHTDTPSVRWAGQSFYGELLEAGIQIYEYQPTFIHSKTMVVDGKWSIIGSPNMDNRSLHWNHENVIGIKDASFGAKLEQVFEDDLTASKEITLETWEDRGIMQRILPVLAHTMVQQF